MAKFRAKARAVELLGKGQIADLPTAIIELWKNRYNACAKNLICCLSFETYNGNKSPLFLISDDGFGMSETDITEKWFVLATDSKARGKKIGDCLHPKKINDNFYFVKRIIEKNYNGLQSAETGFHSFVLQDDEPKCITWQRKPFISCTILNNINKLVINCSGSEISLLHLIILKENYTQRVANELFGYGHRVGIDFPH
jgi:hypothetical protein